MFEELPGPTFTIGPFGLNTVDSQRIMSDDQGMGA